MYNEGEMGECGDEPGDSEPPAGGSGTVKEGLKAWAHLYNNRRGEECTKRILWRNRMCSPSSA